MIKLLDDSCCDKVNLFSLKRYPRGMLFCYFHTKTYFQGTHWNPLRDVFLVRKLPSEY